jgi:4-diphosphocytidyl-2-C-methyl-D-erythritol kinase
MQDIVYYAPAKVNFSLNIGKKESCGLHQIISLMRKINVKDKITFNLTDGSYKIITVAGANLKNKISELELQSLSNEDNITIKTAKLFFNTLNIKNKGVDILIKKNIPFNAGLGGGSSDGAGLLLKLNEIYGNPFAKSELTEIALKIGSDVPFFLTGKDAVVSGFGEKVEEIETDVLAKYYIVLVIPDFGISTKKAYDDYDDFLLTNKSNYYNIQYLGFKDLKLKNDFENVIFVNYKVIEEIKESMILNGAEFSLLSGSGSAVFGAFTSEHSAKDYISKIKSFNFYNRVRMIFLTETL